MTAVTLAALLRQRMKTLAIVLFVVTSGVYGLDGLLRAKRQECKTIPTNFEDRMRKVIGLPEPSSPPTVNNQFQQCRVNGRQGYCRHTRFCPLEEYVTNFDRFQRNACTINNEYLGVCCPKRFTSTCIRPPSQTIRLPPTEPPILPRGRPKEPGKEECGVNFRRRIVNGTNADPKDWVWMVALLRIEQFCGGVLVSDQYVLTAAHCVKNFRSNPRAVKARVGEYNFKVTSESEHQDYDVAEIKIHSSYRDNPIVMNDIALLKLASRVPLGNPTQPICLPSANDNYSGREARVAGWGSLYFNGPTSKILQEVTIPIWPQDRCRRTYERFRQITLAELCAGTYDGGKDSCQGDSGGPLMVENSSKKWMVVGLVSSGEECARYGFPGVYTRVSEFLDWIRTNSDI